MKTRLLDIAEAVDDWEEVRIRIRDKCEGVVATLERYIDTALDNLSMTELFKENSKERHALEGELHVSLRKLERSLRVMITRIVATDPRLNNKGHAASEALAPIADFKGWSFADLGGLLFGSSAGSGIVIAGSRALPAALAGVGISVAAAPVALLAGAAGMAFSAHGLARRKRETYRNALKNSVQMIAVDEADPNSILTRYLKRIDDLYFPLMEL